MNHEQRHTHAGTDHGCTADEAAVTITTYVDTTMLNDLARFDVVMDAMDARVSAVDGR